MAASPRRCKPWRSYSLIPDSLELAPLQTLTASSLAQDSNSRSDVFGWHAYWADEIGPPGLLQDAGDNLHLKVSIKGRVQQWNVLRIRNLRTDIRPKRSEGHTEV
jgi:hypothetical protein